MTDIARLGIQVDTGGVEKGATALNKLQQAAAGVTSVSKNMSGEFASGSMLIRKRIEDMIGVNNRLTKSAKDSAMAMRELLRTKAPVMSRASLGQTPSLVVNNGPSIPRDMMPNRFNTANIAAQFQDIGVTAAMGMNPLIIAMQQGTQVAAIMNSMQSPLAGLAAAFKQILNPISLMSIGLVALVAAGLQMVDWARVGETVLGALGDALSVVAQGLTVVAAAFTAAVAAIGLYNGAMAIATLMTAAGRAALITQMVTMRVTIQLWIMLGIEAIKTAYKSAAAWAAAAAPITLITVGITALIAIVAAAAAAFDGLFGTSLIDSVKKGVNWMIGAFIGAFKAIGAAGEAMWNIIMRKDGPRDIGKAAADAFGKSLETDWLGKIGAEVKDIFTFSSLGDAAGKSGGAAKKDPYTEIVAGAKRRIESLKAEQVALGMTAEQAAVLRYQTELLNDANQKGIKLTSDQYNELIRLGAEMGKIENATKRNAEAMNFAKDASKGFFDDMRQGLQEGKSLWESFGNAVANVLNKIFDKIQTAGIDMLFNGLFPSSSGGILGGSGLLSDIGNFLFSANGNAFNQSGVIKFANGGAFTNGIVNRTTPFAFAGGGAFGVMGEAGPEAIMPLHRGPDGSLGVKMNGAGGTGTAVIININNNSNAQVSTQQRQTSGGLEIDVLIDQMVSQKIAEQGSDTSRSLNARDNRQLVSR